MRYLLRKRQLVAVAGAGRTWPACGVWRLYIAESDTPATARRATRVDDWGRLRKSQPEYPDSEGFDLSARLWHPDADRSLVEVRSSRTPFIWEPKIPGAPHFYSALTCTPFAEVIYLDSDDGFARASDFPRVVVGAAAARNRARMEALLRGWVERTDETVLLSDGQGVRLDGTRGQLKFCVTPDWMETVDAAARERAYLAGADQAREG